MGTNDIQRERSTPATARSSRSTVTQTEASRRKLAEIAMRENEWRQAQLKQAREKKYPGHSAFKARSPEADALLLWVATCMQRSITPKSARDVVEAWYAEWRGKPCKPATITNKLKTHHVDRAAKWMARKENKGLLHVVDREGKWHSKRYLKTERAHLVARIPTNDTNINV